MFTRGQVVKVVSDSLVDAPENARVMLTNDMGEIAGIMFDCPVGVRLGRDLGIKISNLIPLLSVNSDGLYQDLDGNFFKVEKT